MAYNRISALVLLVILLATVTMPTTEAVDCRRYVYAPVCRGISAKRAQMPPIQFRENNPSNGGSYNNALKLKDTSAVAATADEDQVDYETMQMQDDYLRSLLRKYLSRLGTRVGAESSMAA